MSATGRKGGSRIACDNYPTPAWAVHRWLESARRDGVKLEGRLLEPMAGDGAIIRALEDHPLRPGYAGVIRGWTAHELRRECEDALRSALPQSESLYDGTVSAYGIGDVFSIDWEGYGGCRFDHAITNPSYALAFRLLKLLWPICDNITLLLRLNWLEGAAEEEPERYAFLSENMPDVRILPNRPPFAKSKKKGKVGTDATAYAWMTWGPESRGRGWGKISSLGRTPSDIRRAHTALLRDKP